jgi:hypothetical protein
MQNLCLQTIWNASAGEDSKPGGELMSKSKPVWNMFYIFFRMT